jgi:hypothetical protein
VLIVAIYTSQTVYDSLWPPNIAVSITTTTNDDDDSGYHGNLNGRNGVICTATMLVRVVPPPPPSVPEVEVESRCSTQLMQYSFMEVLIYKSTNYGSTHLWKYSLNAVFI